MQLYPLKFKPQIHQKNWGGTKLSTLLNKDCAKPNYNGESWEISGLDGNLSVVSNGYLADNNIEELIEIYMGELVGDKVYDKFGLQFPLLAKFIDAQEDLSIQVHPNDTVAKQKHQAYGKTEMWYVLDAEKDAKIVSGFSKKTSVSELSKHIAEGSLPEVLNSQPVSKGDVFFVPAGTVHAIGKGVLLFEIQQVSDITYRLYDYNRVGLDGNKRELHITEAMEALSFDNKTCSDIKYEEVKNEPQKLVACDYFTTNILKLNKTIRKDIYGLDSFVIYVCVEGSARLSYQGDALDLKLGETVLVPASCREFEIKPQSEETTLLEVYI